MTRPTAVRLVALLVPLALMGGTAAVAAAAPTTDRTHEFCLLVWNDPSGPRDGICVETPPLPAAAPLH